MDILRAQRHGGAEYFHDRLAHEVSPRMLSDQMQDVDELQIVDVRSVDAYSHGHIPGALCMPFERPQGVEYIYHLNKMIPVVVYSSDEYCLLATQAAYLLARNGYQVKTLIGGWQAWVRFNLPYEAGVQPLQALGGTAAGELADKQAGDGR